MEIERFKTKLSKGLLKGMAVDTVKQWIETVSPLDALTFAKRLKVFSDELIRVSEIDAKMVWDQEKSNYPDMTYTIGGVLKDYEQDPIYNSIKIMLSERKELLDTAFKVKDKIFDNEGIEVPKVPVKSYRKDSINVRI